jgi:hypothetical protein
VSVVRDTRVFQSRVVLLYHSCDLTNMDLCTAYCPLSDCGTGVNSQFDCLPYVSYCVHSFLVARSYKCLGHLRGKFVSCDKRNSVCAKCHLTSIISCILANAWKSINWWDPQVSTRKNWRLLEKVTPNARFALLQAPHLDFFCSHTGDVCFDVF